MVLVAYAIFILALAAPFMLAAGVLALLFSGFARIVSGIRHKRRIDIVGPVMILAALLLGTVSYRWVRGPDAELAKLYPLVVDRELSTRLPRTWVAEYGAEMFAFDVLPRKYISRVLISRITDQALLAAIPEGQRDTYMQEIKLVVSPACNALTSSGDRNTSRVFECLTHSAVSKAEVAASGPYLTMFDDSKGDAQTVDFAVVSGGSVKPIARCAGRAPRETNPLLALMRSNRSLDVAASMYKCKMRAAAGALSRVIATGTIA